MFKQHRWTLYAVILFGTLAMGANCPTIPKLEDRTIELAVGAATTLEFDADGTTNVWDETGTYNLATDIDINQVLHDAGIDASQVRDIKLSGISYRVSRAQAGRSLQNANVTASRPGYAGGASQQLVTNFDQDCSATTDWITAPVSAAGVGLVNQLLTDMLNVAKNGGTVSNPSVTYHFSGTSAPTGQNTDYTWQIKLSISIVGKFEEITVIN